MAAKRPPRKGPQNPDEQNLAQTPPRSVPNEAPGGRTDEVATTPLSPESRTLLTEAANVFMLLGDTRGSRS